MATGINRQPDHGISAYNIPKFYHHFAYHRWTYHGLEFTVVHGRLSLLTWNSPSSLLFPLNFTMISSLVTTCALWRSRQQISLSAPCAIWRSFSIFYSTCYFITTATQIFVVTPPRLVYCLPLVAIFKCFVCVCVLVHFLFEKLNILLHFIYMHTIQIWH